MKVSELKRRVDTVHQVSPTKGSVSSVFSSTIKQAKRGLQQLAKKHLKAYLGLQEYCKNLKGDDRELTWEEEYGLAKLLFTAEIPEARHLEIQNVEFWLIEDLKATLFGVHPKAKDALLRAPRVWEAFELLDKYKFLNEVTYPIIKESDNPVLIAKWMQDLQFTNLTIEDTIKIAHLLKNSDKAGRLYDLLKDIKGTPILSFEILELVIKSNHSVDAVIPCFRPLDKGLDVAKAKLIINANAPTLMCSVLYELAQHDLFKPEVDLNNLLSTFSTTFPPGVLQGVGWVLGSLKRLGFYNQEMVDIYTRDPASMLGVIESATGLLQRQIDPMPCIRTLVDKSQMALLAEIICHLQAVGCLNSETENLLHQRPLANPGLTTFYHAVSELVTKKQLNVESFSAAYKNTLEPQAEVKNGSEPIETNLKEVKGQLFFNDGHPAFENHKCKMEQVFEGIRKASQS